MSHSHQRAVELLSQKVRLSSRHKYALYSAFLTLAFSGLVWLTVLAYAQTTPDHQLLYLQVLAMKFHGAAAYLSLIGFGSLLAQHIVRGWYIKKSRITGSFMVIAAVFLATTGFMLYYVAAEGIREVASLLHWLIGLATCLGLPFHILQRTKSKVSTFKK